MPLRCLIEAAVSLGYARWSWPGGQRVLQLRTYVKSDRWEAFWKQYKKRWPAQYDLAA